MIKFDAKLHLTTGSSGLINQKFESAGSAAWRIGIPASQTYFAFDNANDNLSAPKMVIDSSGNVGIGTEGTNIVVTGKGLGIQNIGQDTTASMRLTGANATGNPGVATYTELKHYGADLKFGINHNGGTVRPHNLCLFTETFW
jgi:hypothetical protein